MTCDPSFEENTSCPEIPYHHVLLAEKIPKSLISSYSPQGSTYTVVFLFLLLPKKITLEAALTRQQKTDILRSGINGTSRSLFAEKRSRMAHARSADLCGSGKKIIRVGLSQK